MTSQGVAIAHILLHEALKLRLHGEIGCRVLMCVKRHMAQTFRHQEGRPLFCVTFYRLKSYVAQTKYSGLQDKCSQILPILTSWFSKVMQLPSDRSLVENVNRHLHLASTARSAQFLAVTT